MRVGGCCKVANKYSGSFAPSRWFPPALKHKGECRWCTHTNLTQCPNRESPMRTASDYQTPAVPYHTLICGSFSTPNTALVRKNAEYITNTCDTWDLMRPLRRGAVNKGQKRQKGQRDAPLKSAAQPRPNERASQDVLKFLCILRIPWFLNFLAVLVTLRRGAVNLSRTDLAAPPFASSR